MSSAIALNSNFCNYCQPLTKRHWFASGFLLGQNRIGSTPPPVVGGSGASTGAGSGSALCANGSGWPDFRAFPRGDQEHRISTTHPIVGAGRDVWEALLGGGGTDFPSQHGGGGVGPPPLPRNSKEQGNFVCFRGRLKGWITGQNF